MNRILSIAAAVLIVAGVAYWWQGQLANDTLPNLGVAEAQNNDEAPDLSLVTEMTLGNPDADLTVIEYASFTCPHCKNFHNDTFKKFKENYIDTGKVHFIYREVYFDRFGLWAGMVARCGGESTYFPIADMIYQQQATWTQGENPGAIADNLAKIARTAGLTNEAIDACLQDGEKARAMIATYQQNAESDGVRSTPTFVIDGDVHAGNQGYDAFSALLDAKLGG